MLTAITGINWGDEGKGRMVDLLSQEYDVVCRYQGGNNAGHTVINERGKFILNLLPSGILRDTTTNVMGAGIGKMICPQGIAIGAGAISMVDSESKILSSVFKYFLLYVVIAGIICFAGSVI